MLSDIMIDMNFYRRDGNKLDYTVSIGGISPRFEDLISEDASFGSEVSKSAVYSHGCLD
jgi:hypothetical protein